jgi:hypothetical protein
MTGPNCPIRVVTGAAGYLDAHVADTLLGLSSPVLAMNDFSLGRRECLVTHRDNPFFRLGLASISTVQAPANTDQGMTDCAFKRI